MRDSRCTIFFLCLSSATLASLHHGAPPFVLYLHHSHFNVSSVILRILDHEWDKGTIWTRLDIVTRVILPMRKAMGQVRYYMYTRKCVIRAVTPSRYALGDYLARI